MKIGEKVAKITAFSILFLVVSLIKFSFVLGTKSYFFSGFCIGVPLLGALIGVYGAWATILVTRFWRYFVWGSVFSLSAGIPTMGAAWCWSLDEHLVDRRASVFLLIVNCFVPMICFLLFIIHPSVGNGWLYGLYWFIPVGLYGGQLIGFLRKHSFITALRSTFIAHAIGSTIWCYTVPMTPDAWLSLLPIVAIERLVMASGMMVIYCFAKKLMIIIAALPSYCMLKKSCS